MWFDLKNATISIHDGFSGIAAVNLMAGYMAGATTIIIDGYTGQVPVGVQFYIGTDETHVYTVASTLETGGDTTSLTFTPGLATTAADNAVVTFLPRTLTIKVGEGNLTFNEKNNMEYKRDRGILSTVRKGDEEPLEVSFEFWWEFLKASTGKTPSIEDVLKKRGEAASWLTTSSDTCEPYCVDIVILYTPPCTSEDLEKIELKMFRWETLNHDLKQGMLSCSGKCNVKEATISRIAQA